MQGLAVNQPAAMRYAGVEPAVLPYSKYGIESVANTMIVTNDTLETPAKRKDLERFLHGQILGWRWASKNLAAAVRGVVDQYGQTTGLDYRKVLLISQAQAPFILTPWTRKHGLLTASPAQIKQNLATVQEGGFAGSAADLFDFSVLEGVYKKHPNLRIY
jgi:hypothetical protein